MLLMQHIYLYKYTIKKMSFPSIALTIVYSNCNNINNFNNIIKYNIFIQSKKYNVFITFKI